MNADAGTLLPQFDVVRRLRPVALVAPGSRIEADPATSHRLGAIAPYVSVLADLGPEGTAVLELANGEDRLRALVDDRGVRLETVTASDTQTHRSRRFTRPDARPTALALTLTGTHLTAFTRESDEWVARSRFDLTDELNTRSEAWLAALHASADGAVETLAYGRFGQLGLRDVRLVTEADGTPVRDGAAVWLSATSAGPGFFDTAHTSMWRLDTEELELTHCGDLYFRRPPRSGSTTDVFGDHATHVVRDGDSWLVATSTWGDFAPPASRAQRRMASDLRVTLARTDADPRAGTYVLDTVELPLPVPPSEVSSVGMWDPHLVRHEDAWWVGYVSAERFFRFHPMLASGPSLDALSLRGARTERRATEGTTLVPYDGRLLVLASDGRDGRSGQRLGYPIFDCSMNELGRLRAPYPTNIPWPSVVPPADGVGEWHLVTFNGAPHNERLLGYGTHGELVIMRSAR